MMPTEPSADPAHRDCGDRRRRVARSVRSPLAAGVVVGGAFANVVDRAQAGTPVDMLYTG